MLNLVVFLCIPHMAYCILYFCHSISVIMWGFLVCVCMWSICIVCVSCSISICLWSICIVCVCVCVISTVCMWNVYVCGQAHADKHLLKFSV